MDRVLTRKTRIEMYFAFFEINKLVINEPFLKKKFVEIRVTCLPVGRLVANISCFSKLIRLQSMSFLQEKKFV